MELGAAIVLGGLMLSGFALVGMSLDKVVAQMKRANDLKEAELRNTASPSDDRPGA